MRRLREGRLPEQIAAKKEARLNSAALQVLDKLPAVECCAISNREHEAEPAWFTSRSWLRKMKVLGQRRQELQETGVVGAPSRHEIVDLLQLAAANGRLHVERF